MDETIMNNEAVEGIEEACKTGTGASSTLVAVAIGAAVTLTTIGIVKGVKKLVTNYKAKKAEVQCTDSDESEYCEDENVRDDEA